MFPKRPVTYNKPIGHCCRKITKAAKGEPNVSIARQEKG
tara:strand:- start:1549 stop:1665 length:117 start_codon:yes stop_codon:yes gene_type:complete